MSLAVGVFGVSGIGKSTLLDAHVAQHPSDQHIGGSSIVKQIIAPHSTRELDSWPLERQVAVRDESIRRLRALRHDTPRVLLVAGHFTLRNRVSGELESILTAEDHAFFDALVHIDAPAEAVLAQSSGDARKRHGQTLAQVQAHLEFEREVAQQTAAHMQVPMVRIAEPSVAERCTALEAFLQALLSRPSA